MLDWPTLVVLIGIGLIVGVFIGCVGIGGVLLVPTLTYIGGAEIHVAIASCMLSYLFSGLLGGLMFARRGSIRWPMAGWLCAGAMPGAFLGAATAFAISGVVLEGVIALLITATGLHALTVQRAARRERAPGTRRLAVIGLITGYGSALTGTGGPLLLVPILVWMEVPVLTAIGLSQVIQLPIATLATVGNLAYGSLDYPLALGIAAVLMAGVSGGVRLAHRVPSAVLRYIVAWVLVAIGGAMLVRLSYRSLNVLA